MINTSNEFKDALQKNNTCIVRATIQLKSGKILNIDASNTMQNGTKIDDGTSSPGSFDVGAAVINKLTLTLNNHHDTFSDDDFTDAVITVWVGKLLDGRIEWLKKGVFNAEDPKASTSILTIEALDNMEKFDRSYDGKLTFPRTLQAIVQYCCDRCGVLLCTTRFDNDSFTIMANPFSDEDKMTYREILSYCAQIAGCYARCNTDGQLELKWYPRAIFDADNLDGGGFDTNTPTYSTGDTADGGNFTDYNSGNAIDGGTFTNWQQAHHIYRTNALEVSTDDVVITGIQVTASEKKQDNEILAGETALYGAKGYVLTVEKNPFIEHGRANEVATYLGQKIVGMRFRKMSASCLGDPSIEAGDAAYISDRKGNTYHCYITNLTYTVNGFEQISTDAETPSRNTAKRYSEITKAIIESGKNTDIKLSQYDTYVGKMNELAMNAMGYYQTIADQSDGSRISYMHDKPKLTESMLIYKISADGFFMSRDGGKTYTHGVDKNGNAVMNVIAAIGIVADWVNTRGLKAQDNDGKTTFEVDAATGRVSIDADLITIKSENVTTENEMTAAIESSAAGLKQEFSTVVSGVITGNNNMLTGTALKTNKYVTYTSTDGSTALISPIDSPAATSGWTMRITMLNPGKGLIRFSKNIIQLKAGKTYTISAMMACGIPSLNVTFGMTSSNGSKTVALTEKFLQYDHTFTPSVSDTGTNYAKFFIQMNEPLPSTGGIGIIFADIKLTENAAPTPWAPSAADISDELEVYSTTAEINASIESRAAKLTKEFNTRLGEYPTTIEMNGAITTNAAGLTAQFNAKLGNYSNTMEMQSAIQASASGLQANFTQKLTNYATVTQMNTSILASANGISATISSQLANGVGKIQTTKFVLDLNGLLIKNGGITIQNNAGAKVFYGDTSGNLVYSGVLEQRKNGNLTLRVRNNVIDFYAPQYTDNFVGFIGSMDNAQGQRQGIIFGHDVGDVLTVSRRVSGGYVAHMEFSDYGISVGDVMTFNGQGPYMPDVHGRGGYTLTLYSNQDVQCRQEANSSIMIPVWAASFNQGCTETQKRGIKKLEEDQRDPYRILEETDFYSFYTRHDLRSAVRRNMQTEGIARQTKSFAPVIGENYNVNADLVAYNTDTGEPEGVNVANIACIAAAHTKQLKADVDLEIGLLKNSIDNLQEEMQKLKQLIQGGIPA